MRVLVACEMSGRVRQAFRDKGHDAWSCDILPSMDDSPYHIHNDVLKVLHQGWDLMIAHPPCTYLCNSGVRWLFEQEGRRQKTEKAVKFFETLLKSKIQKIAIENPIPHRYGVGKTYTQIIQPWQFGHGETKATCLWLKNLPKLQPTDIVGGRKGRIHKIPPSKDRGMLRSLTYEGIARAMAEQWG